QETLTPTYKLRLGVPGASAGLNIASRLGLSPEIIAAARAQLSTQTADIAAFLDRLHQQLAAVNEERAALAQKEEELRKQKILLDLEGRAEVKQRTRELEKKLDSLLNDFDTQLRESVKAIGDKAVARRLQRDSATTIARARREFGEQFKTTVTEHMNPAKSSTGAAPEASQAPATPEPGDTVRLKSLNRQARVERVLERTSDGIAKTLEVAVGPMKMKIAIGDIAEIEKAKPAATGITPLEAARRKGGVTVSTIEDPDFLPMELNVIGRTADEAHDEVARYIDRAFLAGMPRIRIVHGTGMGILRRTLRDFLRSHPHVANITEPPQNLGGQGATEVELRQ
ncbi:MAG TPA: Smr/MutS family protein, partial [Edaphobacter sp.]